MKADEKGSYIDGKHILDADHYGLEKVKERIWSFWPFSAWPRCGVQSSARRAWGGKDLLAKSVAKALDRGFVRISLGGVLREVRGHRRTMGVRKNHQALKQAGQPSVMLDE